MMYPIVQEGVDLLKKSESFVGVAYPDPASKLGRALQAAGLWRQTLRGAPIPTKFDGLDGRPWTIGYGFTDHVSQGDTMTPDEADTRLSLEMHQVTDEVRGACKITPSDNQLAALVVCAWNIGVERLIGSSIMKAHNRGDFAAAARAFSLWNKAGGQVLPALVTRRTAEAALYLKPDANAAVSRVDVPQDDEVPDVAPMPQTVQGESSLLRSPIVQGTAATATTGVTALAQLADQANTVQGALTTLHPLLQYWPYVAIAAIVIVAGATIWYRVQQRKGGWA